MCCIVFISSSTDGHLGCFQFEAIRNNVAMSSRVQVFVFSFLWVPRSEMLGHMVDLCLTF